MGSLTRVNVSYLDLEAYLESTNNAVFGTFMTGETIYSADLPTEGVVVLGNEANGISEAIRSKVHKQITIPQFGNTKATESLNVANAAAIVLSEFRRRTIEM
jgi:TrmH family RNA methyltransferase